MQSVNFKKRFQGKTTLIGKDGVIGVVREASNPINSGSHANGFGHSKSNVRHKRAISISQDYSFDAGIPSPTNFNHSVGRSSDRNKRKRDKRNNHSLSEVGSSIISSRSHMGQYDEGNELNRSMKHAHNRSVNDDKVLN